MTVLPYTEFKRGFNDFFSIPSTRSISSAISQASRGRTLSPEIQGTLLTTPPHTQPVQFSHLSIKPSPVFEEVVVPGGEVSQVAQILMIELPNVWCKNTPKKRTPDFFTLLEGGQFHTPRLPPSITT